MFKSVLFFVGLWRGRIWGVVKFRRSWVCFFFIEEILKRFDERSYVVGSEGVGGGGIR